MEFQREKRLVTICELIVNVMMMINFIYFAIIEILKTLLLGQIKPQFGFDGWKNGMTLGNV